MRHLVVAVQPHIISALTIPEGQVERAMTEPLASGRDEVLYLICTHERIRFGEAAASGKFPVVKAMLRTDGGVEWDRSTAWAWVTLPDGAYPSENVPWTLIDPGAAAREGLAPITVDPDRDPDGEAGAARQELLPWIFGNASNDPDAALGRVEFSDMSFRVEYIGRSSKDALRRSADGHHKLHQVLGQILLKEPHRLVYVLPCQIQGSVYTDTDVEAGNKILMRALDDLAKGSGITRAILIAAVEEALIAGLGGRHNKANTGKRAFPRSATADKLRALDIEDVFVQFLWCPDEVSFVGTHGTIAGGDRASRFAL